jgi:glycerate kinase
VRIVVAPDSFGGTLTAARAAAAIADGWRRGRPEDRVDVRPMSDGGEGFVGVVARPDDEVVVTEVAGPRGHPVEARWLLRDDTAWVEAALANGLALLAPDERDPLVTTSHGVGELVAAARARGVARVMLGLGGSATVDGGAGALTALGFALRESDGSGLKVGGGELARIDSIAPTWVEPGWDEVEVVALADVGVVLAEAAPVFGPQKGADNAAVATLARCLAHFAEVVERDLDVPGLASRPGTGAAGGLAFGLAAGLGATIRAGAPVVADAVGLDDALREADLVVTGEGRVDATTATGKVVAEVATRAHTFAVPMAVVAGSGELPEGVDGEFSSPGGPPDDPDEAAGQVADAAARLAERWGEPAGRG